MNRILSPWETMQAAIRGLKHPQAAHRIKAVRGLMHPQGVAREVLPYLQNMVDDSENSVREAAVQAMVSYGADALPTLTRLLHHPDKYVRRYAVWGVGKLGLCAASCTATLCSMLRDPDPRTASSAAQVLGTLRAASAVPALIEAMRGSNVVLCRLASKALSEIGLPALNSLIAHLKHHDPFVRCEAALAIGWIGGSAIEAVPALIQLIETSRPAGAAARPAHQEETPDYVSLARINAVQALGRVGADSKSARELLARIANRPDDPARAVAETSLRQLAG